MNSRHALLLGSALLCSHAAHALNPGELTLDLNGASWHSESQYTYQGTTSHYQQSNPGLGLTYAFDDHINLTAGFFENSYRKTTVYAGAVIHQDFRSADDEWVLSPGIALLLGTGYEDTPEETGTIAPVAAFSLSAGHKNLQLGLLYIPFGDVDMLGVQLQYHPADW